ncbi:hypothetical protein PV10_01188 [Exophiala mesophila]|uniref:FAS1 domain-containing protein n=1 Tax=Exophiala mesophila TaxID=212818 RepID=A0A0D1X6H6_EXOME|nr:uncharacterized protein PV10_01188 [Exophiala mesophila]KIV97435.1 hypothetical protein PV10_01188 [Exophiala mesophila]
MLRRAIALSATLATAALAQSHGPFTDLVSVLNGTHGFSSINAFMEYYPKLRDSLNELKNVTVLLPKDTAVWEFIEDPRYAALEAAGEDALDALLRYHFIDGVHDNITDWVQYHTLLTSPEYTGVTGGQVVFGYNNDHGFEKSFYGGADLSASAGSEPILFDGGIVYPVDNVLTIPTKLEEEVEAVANETAFVQALQSAGLLEEVQALTDVTYFVPNNTAFQLVQDSLSELSAEELADVLKYHIVQGTILYYSTFKDGVTLKTLQGDDVTITINAEEYTGFVNGALFTWSDMPVANGVVIIIDNVLNPSVTDGPADSAVEEGVAAWPTNAIPTTTDDSAAAATTSEEAAAYTGAAPSMHKVGTVSIAAMIAMVAFAVAL